MLYVVGLYNLLLIYFIFVIGIFKKFQLLLQKKVCEQIKDQCYFILNYLYWFVVISNGDNDFVEEKWLFILNYVCDVYEGYGDRFQVFKYFLLVERFWMIKGKILQ